jgi:hypothetical protein
MTNLEVQEALEWLEFARDMAEDERTKNHFRLALSLAKDGARLRDAVRAEFVEDPEHDHYVGGTWLRLISASHAPDWKKGRRVLIVPLKEEEK